MLPSPGAGELAKVVNTNSGTTTTTTWTSYAYWDEAKEVGKTISGYNPVLEENNGLWPPGMSSMSYDVNGPLASSTDAGKDGMVRMGKDIRFQYVTNAQGIVWIKGATLEYSEIRACPPVIHRFHHHPKTRTLSASSGDGNHNERSRAYVSLVADWEYSSLPLSYNLASDGHTENYDFDALGHPHRYPLRSVLAFGSEDAAPYNSAPSLPPAYPHD